MAKRAGDRLRTKRAEEERRALCGDRGGQSGRGLGSGCLFEHRNIRSVRVRARGGALGAQRSRTRARAHPARAALDRQRALHQRDPALRQHRLERRALPREGRGVSD
jgi:hypothetical protein